MLNLHAENMTESNHFVLKYTASSVQGLIDFPKEGVTHSEGSNATFLNTDAFTGSSVKGTSSNARWHSHGDLSVSETSPHRNQLSSVDLWKCIERLTRQNVQFHWLCHIRVLSRVSTLSVNRWSL